MKYKKACAVILAAALILSCSACAKNVKTSIDEVVSSDAETSAAESMDSTTDSGITTDTSAATTTETTASAAQTTKKPTTTKKQEIIKKPVVQPKSDGSNGNSAAFTTTKATTVPPASSSDQQKLYQLYSAAYAKTTALKSIDADFSLVMNMSMSGQSSSANCSGNVKETMNGGDIKALVHESLQGSGESQTFDAYYANGYMYISTNGQKVKGKVDVSSFESQTSVSLSSKDLTEKDFQYAKSSVSNGYTTITMNLSGDSAGSILGSSLNESSQNSKNNYSDITVEVVITPDGYLKSLLIKCNVTETISTSSSTTPSDLKMDMTVKYTYNNPGQPVTITAPSDLNSYQEISE